VWSCDFAADRTNDGKTIQRQNIMAEYTRECLAVLVDRKTMSIDVIGTLVDIFIKREMQQFIRSDDGP
jgi:hypothetical protein